MLNEDAINNLREALNHSPNNIPLKLHLAGMLLESGAAADAEIHFKEILALDNNQAKAKAGLAKSCYLQKKYSTAIVILEELLAGDDAPELAVLLSKSLLKEGSIAKAVEVYQKVLRVHPEFSDKELDENLRMPNAMTEEFADEENERLLLEKPSIKFADVGGMTRVKQEIELKIIKPLTHPELYKAYGKKAGGGILLYGPPGCGKTYLAKATAGEVNAKFMNIGINDVLDMWMGNSEKNLHEVFALARRNKPCVLFFDEVDALGASRSDMRQSSGRHLINQFLAELDGLDADNDGILILGATNAPWHLDAAFRRPGRFDRIIFVEPPDSETRMLILQLVLKGKPVEMIDYAALAKKTEDYSGADLKAVVDICIEEKLTESFKTGMPHPITTKNLLDAAAKHRPSTKEWFNTAKNYAVYANDSGLYDDILKYMKIKK